MLHPGHADPDLAQYDADFAQNDDRAPPPPGAAPRRARAVADVPARRRLPNRTPPAAPGADTDGTWAEVARDNFLASFPPGIPPWACEALKPEFRPRTMTLAEILEPYTEEELAAYYY